MRPAMSKQVPIKTPAVCNNNLLGVTNNLVTQLNKEKRAIQGVPKRCPVHNWYVNDNLIYEKKFSRK